MTGERLTIPGGCHCGNLTFEMESDRAPEEIPLRTCGCSFCVAQGAVYTSDPEGFVRFRARDPARVGRYRFGHGTADFLICRDCGVYLGVVMHEQGHSCAVINVKACAEPERFVAAAGANGLRGRVGGRPAFPPPRQVDPGPHRVRKQEPVKPHLIFVYICIHL